MYENETYEAILDRFLSKFPDTFDKRQGSVLWDLFSPMAIELTQAYIQMDNVLNLGFAESTSGEYLERRVAEQGLVRKEAVKSTGFITVSGPQGTVVSPGTRVSTSDTVPIYFVTTEEKVIDADTVYISIESEIGGSDGNVAIGAISLVAGDLSGTITVTNELALTGGINEETDEELYARYHEKVSRPSTSGNKYHYEQWAKEVAGIADARCYPKWNGVGTVKVVVINGEKRSPSATVIGHVSEYIETQRPVLADVTVVGVTELSIDIYAALTIREGADVEVVRESISAKITDYFKRIAFVDDTVRYTAIGNAILDAVDVIDYSDLRINATDGNIILKKDEVPVIGAVSLNKKGGVTTWQQ